MYVNILLTPIHSLLYLATQWPRKNKQTTKRVNSANPSNSAEADIRDGDSNITWSAGLWTPHHTTTPPSPPAHDLDATPHNLTPYHLICACTTSHTTPTSRQRKARDPVTAAVVAVLPGAIAGIKEAPKGRTNGRKTHTGRTHHSTSHPPPNPPKKKRRESPDRSFWQSFVFPA